MGRIQSHSLLFLLHFCSLQLLSSSYTLPQKYFINCGSDANVTAARRTFIGDLSPWSSVFSLTGPSRAIVEDSNRSTGKSRLYQTARLFRQPASYQFDISSSGTYLVRLHFFAFASSYDLSTVLFDVSASGFSLLHNFTVSNSSSPPVIKEFLLSISKGKFLIEFIPQASSSAFVNALEVFLAPDSFVPNDAPHIVRAGSNGGYQGLLSEALLTIYRINAGGPPVTPDNDTLWRNWVPDDSFLYHPDTAKSFFSGDKPNYQGGMNNYVAPDYVYQTVREMMNINSSRISNSFNITWSFPVKKNTRHFIRFHFCDIVSRSLNVTVFNLYIYGNYVYVINPYEVISLLAAPFYVDFVVDSDDSGLMNVSIGPNRDSTDKNAFLNGVEIMEILLNSGSKLGRNECKETHHYFVVIALVLGGLALLCILVIVSCLSLRRRKPKTVEIQTADWLPAAECRGGSTRSRLPSGSISRSNATSLNLGLRIPLVEIQLATNNFDAKMRIGKGGFGNVFKGTLRNGIKVAVKRSEPGSGQGLPEFQAEIMVLSRIRHRHLVSLIGYCDERSEMILVYEFMEKGTLRDHLYSSALPSLSWKQRLEICVGAARGLQYLHRGSSGGFIHRDVKSTNILLDESLVAKVADFGLSRLGPPDETHVSTGVKGTFGYLDPDYFRTQQLTEKSDVYSFGVVLLEVLCARPAISVLLPSEQVNLAEWALFCKHRGTLDQVIDPSIKGQISSNSLRKFMETAEKCLQEYGSDRPTMADVLWDLEYALQLQRAARGREPYEDSRTDASAMLGLANVQGFPSFSSTKLERDDMPILRDDSSSTSDSLASEVFSQMQIDGAR